MVRTKRSLASDMSCKGVSLVSPGLPNDKNICHRDHSLRSEGNQLLLSSGALLALFTGSTGLVFGLPSDAIVSYR